MLFVPKAWSDTQGSSHSGHPGWPSGLVVREGSFLSKERGEKD